MVTKFTKSMFSGFRVLLAQKVSLFILQVIDELGWSEINDEKWNFHLFAK